MCSMRKIKTELYNWIISDKTLSRLELRLLFWLAAHQDEKGNVTGIYFKDIADELHCSVSGFYRVRDSLTEKEYITWDKSDSADMDIKLYDNDFVVDGEIVYKNYVDIDIAMFRDDKFFEIKAGAIKLAMYFVKRIAAAGAVTMTNSKSGVPKEAESKRKLWYNPLNLLSDIKAKLFCKDNRSAKEYMEELKPWIQEGFVQSEGSKYRVVTVLKKSILKSEGKKEYPEKDANEQCVKMFCRRNKIEHNKKNLKDTADLIWQYRKYAALGKFNIRTLLCKAIENTCSTVLNSYNVHKSLRNLIEYNAPGILA